MGRVEIAEGISTRGLAPMSSGGHRANLFSTRRERSLGKAKPCEKRSLPVQVSSSGKVSTRHKQAQQLWEQIE
ncbi:MAG: hypothetical protein CVV19_11115 [Gammaproteobacteria bacterium HGW-Gammaproteobacteria-9]|nr:MAG: hypothetical protein CVV19_11115 [Gammaproteobacteria bacterium HGW-Gammaproteobacteria-9]